MSFDTCFMNLGAGVWRHATSGLVVHEVFNTDQVLACNGVLVYWDEDDGYAVAAGRTLGNVMRSRSVNSLSDFGPAFNFAVTGAYDLSTTVTSTSGHGAEQVRQIQVAYDLPVPALKPRVFAIVTNCVDGFKARRYGIGSFGANIATQIPVAVLATGTINASSVGIGNHREVSGLNTTHVVVPHFIARLESGATIDQYIGNLRSSVNEISRAEVSNWFDNNARGRVERVANMMPLSTFVELSFVPSLAGPQLLTAVRQTATTDKVQGVAAYHAHMLLNGEWLRIPKPVCSNGVDPFNYVNTAIFRYNTSLTGKIGGVPVGKILGGVGGLTTSLSGLSLTNVFENACRGLSNLTGDVAMSSQGESESIGNYENRLLATKPTYSSGYAGKRIMHPASDYPGSIGWTAAVGALALNDYASLGEFLSVIAAYAQPTRFMVHEILQAALNEANAEPTLGQRVWEMGSNLEAMALLTH